MDAVAQCIVDVVLSEKQSPFALNIVHPRPIPWTKIIGSISDALCARSLVGQKLPFVSLGKWVALVEAYTQNATEKDVDIMNIVSSFCLI